MTSAAMLFEMETEIIHNMIRLLERGSVDSAIWQAERLTELGLLKARNRKITERELPKIIEQAKTEIKAAGYSAANKIDWLASEDKLRDALPVSASPRLREVIGTWENQTMNQMNNLGMTLIKQSERLYIDTIYKATAERLSGVTTSREAIAKASAEWRAKGLPALVDKAGRKWSSEAYAQVVVRSNVRQVSTQTADERCSELDIDLVEVSSHLGARPLCEPYQGKVYSLRGLTKGYPLLYQETSYGDPAGLFGCNCRHTFYPYQPGTEKTYKPYPKRENDKAYELSQQQRKLERNIRQAKREENPEKVKEYQSQMRTLVNDNNLTREYAREQIF